MSNLTRLSPHSIRRLLLLVIFTSALLMVGRSSTTNAAAPCLDAQTLDDGTACSTGQVCTGARACSAFDLVLRFPAVTGSSATITLDTNAFISPTFHAYSCIGDTTTCGTPASKPSLWTDLGTTTGGAFTTNGLRASRTYTISYAGVFQSVTSVKSQSFTTWPLPQFTPTVSAIGADTATISWTTPFAGDSRVKYWAFPPGWTLMSNPSVGGGLASMTSTSSGHVWASGFSGGVVARDELGNWSSQSTGTISFLYGIDAFNDNIVWAVGGSGTAVRTSNGGLSWSDASPTGANLYGVIAATSNTAWAVGDGRIMFFNGTSWQEKYSSAGKKFNSITTINNSKVWAVGDGGIIVSSSDGGSSWQVANPVGSNLITIATLDGQTLWAGGIGGVLLKSTDGGVSWSSVATSAARFDSIYLVNNNEFWSASNTSIGHYQASASPQFQLDATPGGLIGSGIVGLTVVDNDQIFGSGQSSKIVGLSQAGTPQKDLSTATSHSLTLTGLSSDQTFFYSAESFGAGVGSGAFGTFTTVSPDTTPPTISFTAPPSPGPTYTNVSPFNVTGVANDTAPGTVKSVALTSNGAPQTVAGTTSWSSTLTPSAGLNSLVATATDGGNNTATATSGVFYDPTKPTITITSPANGAVLNTTPITVTGTAGDNDQVATVELSVNGGPRSSVTITPSGSVSWSSPTSLVSGTNTIIAYATDRTGNTQSTQITVTYAAPDITLSVAPASQNGFVGDVKTYTATVTSKNGFTGPVTLTASSSPTGLGLSFSSPTVSLTSGGTATSTLTVTTASVVGATYTITTAAASSVSPKTAAVQLVLDAAPDFTISASPSPLNVVAGTSDTYQVTVSSNSTFAGPINFSIVGVPSGATYNINPLSVTVAKSQTVNTNQIAITTRTTTPIGDYTLTITGDGTNTASGTTVSHSTTVVLHVSPAPDIGLTVLPAVQTVNAGGAGTSYNITVSSLDGFGGTGTAVNLSVTSDYTGSGLSLLLMPSQVVLATGDTKNSSLNVTAANNVPGGTYHLTVTATGSGVTKQATVNLDVVEDTAPPVISGITAFPNYNSVRVTWTTDEPADSSISVYTDATRATLVGTNSASATCTSTCHDLVYTPLNPLTTYYYTVSSTDTDPTPHTTTVSVDGGGNPLQFTTLDTPDTTPPTVTLAVPADSTPPTVVTGTVTVSGTANDDKNVSLVKLTITNVATGAKEVDTSLTCTGVTCSYSYAWDTLARGAAGNGVHTVTVVAQDKAGNVSPSVTHTVNVDNDFTNPVVTSGPDAGNLICAGATCQITITWSTDDASTSEVWYQTPAPSYCDPVSGVCTYTQHQQYDDSAPSDASPVYTAHSVTLKNLTKDVIYHYRVVSCNRTGLCLQGG